MTASRETLAAMSAASPPTETAGRDEKEIAPNRHERRRAARQDRLAVPIAMLTIDQSAHALNVCRAHVYALIAKGKVKSIKFGRCRRVPVSEIERLTATAR